MGSDLARNRHSTNYIKNRRFRTTTTDFFKFSPSLLRLRLLPGWVYFSLAANGLLLSGLAVLGLRSAYLGSPSIAIADPGSANAQASLTTVSSSGAAHVESPTQSSNLGTRHQLNYQQWQELLAQEAKVAAEQKPNHLSILAGDSISLWFPETVLPPERNWLNQAISGETSSGLLKRLDLFGRTQPETIFVMIGINDLLKGISDEEVLINHEEIVRYLQEVHPQAQIVLQSILPHAAEKATWEGRDRLLSLPNRRIQNLNQQLEKIAQQQEVYFLDLYPLFADAEGNLRMEYSTDGLHLNPQGYQVWSIALQVYGHEVLQPDLGQPEF